MLLGALLLQFTNSEGEAVKLPKYKKDLPDPILLLSSRSLRVLQSLCLISQPVLMTIITIRFGLMWQISIAPTIQFN